MAEDHGRTGLIAAGHRGKTDLIAAGWRLRASSVAAGWHLRADPVPAVCRRMTGLITADPITVERVTLT